MAHSAIELYDRVRLPSGRTGRVIDQEQWRSYGGVGMCRVVFNDGGLGPVWLKENLLTKLPLPNDPVRRSVAQRIEKWKNGGCL